MTVLGLALSAFHIVAWSAIPDIVRAGAEVKLLVLDDRMGGAVEATVANCCFCLGQCKRESRN